MERKKPRNLYEYHDMLEVKISFYRTIKKKTGVSITAVASWCNGDRKTSNKRYLEVLSNETQIPIEDLFKNFDYENA